MTRISLLARTSVGCLDLSKSVTRSTFVTLTKPTQMAAANSTGGLPNVHNSNDKRHDLMKNILFEVPPRQLPKDLTKEDLERHETIMRAYKLFNRQKFEARRQERERKFQAMKNAFEELRLTDNRLFESANRQESHATFPRQMRRFVETPPASPIWKY